MENKNFINKQKISIICVNWWGKDFAELLINSVVKNTKNFYEIIIVDNSGELKDRESIKIIKPGHNLGHGIGLNYGIRKAKGEYILVLDIDSHILLENWDEKLIKIYNADNTLRIIGAEGGLLKPMRPAVMFFKKDFFINNDMTFAPCEFNGVKFDVGIHFYFKTLSLGYSVKFLKWKKTDFKNTMGEEYTLGGVPAFFHHWWATRWYNKYGKRVHDEIDGIKWEDFKIKKDNFFKQI